LATVRARVQKPQLIGEPCCTRHHTHPDGPCHPLDRSEMKGHSTQIAWALQQCISGKTGQCHQPQDQLVSLVVVSGSEGADWLHKHLLLVLLLINQRNTLPRGVRETDSSRDCTARRTRLCPCFRWHRGVVIPQTVLASPPATVRHILCPVPTCSLSEQN